jgi:3'(2'), 5'-bisphosphate nucleotidase
MLKQPLIQNIIHISHLAGDKIMDIYQNDFAIYENQIKAR